MEFINELRDKFKPDHLPILILSVQLRQGKVDKVLNGGAFNLIDWIEKPVNTKRLLQSVRTLKAVLNVKTLKILHVEDDKDLAHIVAKILQHEGDITNVYTLKDAEAKIQQENFDVVILDSKLPDGSGIQLLPYCSKKNIPVVVFTAYDFPNKYINEVTSVLTKSKISNQGLLDTVKSAILMKEELTK